MKKVLIGAVVGLLAGIGIYTYAKNKGATEMTHLIIDMENDIDEGKVNF